MREKILKLLGSGLSPSLTATAVGCDPSYISQLMMEEAFATQVAELRCKSLTDATERDGKYDKLEDALLEKLEDILPLMLKPRDVLDALTRINGAKRRGAAPLAGGADARNIIINLSLPQIAVTQFQLSNESEVIDVGGRPLVNMPAGILMRTLEDRRALDAPENSKQPLRLSTKQAERSVITENDV